MKSAIMYSTACAVFLSGVVVGVLFESGMMDAMVQFLINIIAVCAAGNL